ncbi:hypothetical protein N7E01_09845 [Neopusillimonas aromaticivorans]|nr:hypothetical protein [Neopusillimonas aromaticivorans]WJJ92643.1 hypothetical protein N7E01_09845 [Neopusillimonas aromaticivorans]
MSQTSNDFALRCTAYGNPPEIHVIEGVSETPLGSGEVRLAIDCSAFNFTDHLLVQGRYQEKPELPFTPALMPPVPSPLWATMSQALRRATGSSPVASAAHGPRTWWHRPIVWSRFLTAWHRQTRSLQSTHT